MVYFFNIPKAIHRGVEAEMDWRPFDGWRFRAAYSFNDQFSTDYVERISGQSFDRRGNKIPNVPPHLLTARLGYDQPDGDLKGFGAFLEYVYKSSYALDMGNLLYVPSYGIVNLNIHYSRSIQNFYIRNIEVFFNIDNLFDRTYIAGATPAADTLTNGVQTPAPLLANSTGAGIVAGSPRAFIGGVKFKF
jgi:iron complex outermembrane receptor protein